MKSTVNAREAAMMKKMREDGHTIDEISAITGFKPYVITYHTNDQFRAEKQAYLRGWNACKRATAAGRI